jgi:ankyrin repeat protein
VPPRSIWLSAVPQVRIVIRNCICYSDLYLVDTVSLLLSHRAISPNATHPPGSGTTALHLAASLGRVDIVSLLLEQDGIDDTIRDESGKTVKDVARGRDAQRILRGASFQRVLCVHTFLTIPLIVDSRLSLTSTFRSLLRTYIVSPLSSSPPSALLGILSSPRSRHVNLSYLDEDSGTSLLHEASRRKDASLVELAIRAGADIFVRDRRGRTVQDVVGKDDKMRAFLRQCTCWRHILPCRF